MIGTPEHPIHPLDRTEVVRRGRPTKLTEDVAAAICDRFGDGEDLHEICRREDMPSAHTVYRWARTNNEFAESFAAALQARFLLRTKEIEAIAADATNDYVESVGADNMPTVRPNKEGVARSALRIETIYRNFAKLFPHRLVDPLPVAMAAPAIAPAKLPLLGAPDGENIISLLDAYAVRGTAVAAK